MVGLTNLIADIDHVDARLLHHFSQRRRHLVLMSFDFTLRQIPQSVPLDR